MYKLHAILNEKGERYIYENEITGFMITKAGDILLNCVNKKQVYYPNHSWVIIELRAEYDYEIEAQELLIADGEYRYRITSHQIDMQTGIMQAFTQSNEDEPAECVYIFNPSNIDFITVE